MALTLPDLADQGQRLAMRLLTKAGGLSVLGNPDVRRRVERWIAVGSERSFQAQVAVGRAFTRRPGAGDATRVRTADRLGEFDLTPTEDQQMLADAAGELADEVIRPAGSRADAERSVPAEVAAALTDMGLTLIGVPAELGGIAEERSAVATCLVLEQLARGDMGIAVSAMASAAVATALASYGDAAQQATYLPHFTGEGDQKDVAPVVAALALMEPQPLFDALTPRTTGTTLGQDIVLSGTKALVPHAASADLFVVSATVDGIPRLVIVERGLDGVRVEDEPAMGVRAAATGRLVLDDVTVTAASLLGDEADHRDVVRRARLAWSALAMGTARAALDQLVPYVKERKAFGEPIGHRQAVAFTLSNLAIELDGLRLVVLKAAARLDAGLDASREIALARRLTASHGAVIGSDAVQLLGGHGFVKEWDNERWFRDLRGAGLLEGALLV